MGKEEPERGRKAARCNSHGGQGVQGGEGSRGDAGDPVVVERQQTHRAQTRERAVVNAADLVAPQHSGNTHTKYI